jgi:hypothetical protein
MDFLEELVPKKKKKKTIIPTNLATNKNPFKKNIDQQQAKKMAHTLITLT